MDKSNSKKRGRSRVCSIVGCNSSDYQLNKWKEEVCTTHGVLHGSCTCEPPFSLFTFPTKKANPDDRTKWKRLVNRKTKANKPWTPGKQSRVCSLHFSEGRPSQENPLPTINLGYESQSIVKKYTSKRRRLAYNDDTVENTSEVPSSSSSSKNAPSLIGEITEEIVDEKSVDNEFQSTLDTSLEPPIGFSMPNDLFSLMTILIVAVCFTLKTLCVNQQLLLEVKTLNLIITALYKEVKSSRAQNIQLRKKMHSELSKCTCKKPMFEKLLSTDENTLFYTGISSRKLYFKLYTFIKPYVRRRWSGLKGNYNILKRNFSKIPKQMGPKRVLDGKDEFLLCLMKLRLGLLNRDLADRFQISSCLASKVFASWLRASRMVLEKVVFIPDLGTLNITKPPHFRPISNLHSIIDGTEFFIATPKDHKRQKQTFSTYKHHNTVKVLVAVSANSSIIFVSSAYAGSISDKRLTNDCGYLEKIEPYSKLMTDKGFDIRTECEARSIELVVPPGRCGTSQMTVRELTKTKFIAKMRIIVEQVIRQMKCFRILASEIPINMLIHIDDIIMVCAALTNLKSPIYK